jgi:hypothetical protein
MKKLWLTVFVIIMGLLASCSSPSDNSPNNKPDGPDNPNQNTFIVFDNTQGICAVSVYDDYRRRDEDKIAEVSAGRSSAKIEWTPGDSVPFYLSYKVTFKNVDNFGINYIPVVGRDQKQVRIDANTTNTNTKRNYFNRGYLTL